MSPLGLTLHLGFEGHAETMTLGTDEAVTVFTYRILPWAKHCVASFTKALSFSLPNIPSTVWTIMPILQNRKVSPTEIHVPACQKTCDQEAEPQFTWPSRTLTRTSPELQLNILLSVSFHPASLLLLSINGVLTTSMRH
jgi:hypothetical protein